MLREPQKDRKSILLLTSRVPFPPIGGDKLKSYNLIKILSKHFNVTLISLSEDDLSAEANEFLTSHCSSVHIVRRSKAWSILGAAKSLFSGEPLQIGYYYFSEVQKLVDENIASSDFAIATLVRMAKYVSPHTSCKRVLDAVDSISLNYNRSVRNVRSFWWKIIYTIEAKRLWRYERLFVRSFDISLFVNNYEASYWSKHGCVAWIPNGVRVENVTRLTSNERSEARLNVVGPYVAFLGKMDYQPNIDAVIWFIDNILPLIDERVKFVCVGASPAASILDRRSARVVVTGFVDDPFTILRDSLCVVAPMRTGGGIQNKILESMAIGKAVISTSLGASPIIGARDSIDIFVRDDPSDFAKLINENVESGLFDRIGASGADLVRTHYSWDEYERKLMNVFESLGCSFHT